VDRSRKGHRTVRNTAAALVFGLGSLSTAACGDLSTGAADGAQDQSAALDIWIRKPDGSHSEKTAKKIAAAFTTSSGTPTKVTALFEDFETKLQQAAAQKNLPDLVINDTGGLGALVTQGLVRRVNRDEIAGAESLTPISWQAAQGADGNDYAVPFSAQSFALFIRSDWRKKMGLRVPQTWAELDALAAAFTTGDPDGNGEADTYGYVVPGSTKRGYTSWYLSSFLWSGRGDFISGSDGAFFPAIAHAESVAAVDWFKNQFCDAGTVVPGAVTMETTKAHSVFESGQAGIYFTGPYNMARFDKSLGKDRYEVVPAPPGPGGESVSLAEGENIYLMAGSTNEGGQEGFAEFAISTEGQMIGMAGGSDGGMVRLPVNSTIDLASVRTDERWQTFESIYRDSGRYIPAVPDWTPFRQASAEAINAIVADCGSDTEAELDKLSSTFGAELEKQGIAG
jgi:multiple sugar transport system substrate-binding protein